MIATIQRDKTYYKHFGSIGDALAFIQRHYDCHNAFTGPYDYEIWTDSAWSRYLDGLDNFDDAEHYQSIRLTPGDEQRGKDCRIAIYQ